MGRFYTLDALRGFAALIVVIYHIDKALIPQGYLAVDLFFMLSGFVVSHAYGDKFGIFELTRARLIRLYPLFFAGMVVGLVIRGGHLHTLFFIPESGRILYPANTALWSVLYELIASVAFAFFVRYGWVAWAPLWLASTIYFAIWIFGFGQTASVGFGGDGLAIGLMRLTFSFTTGIGLYWIFQRLNRRAIHPIGWLVGASPFAMVYLPDLIALMIGFPILVLLGAVVQVRSTVVATELGRISYPLYAIHLPVVVAFGWLSLPFVIVGARLLDRYYDVPVRRWLARKTGRLKGSPNNMSSSSAL